MKLSDSLSYRCLGGSVDRPDWVRITYLVVAHAMGVTASHPLSCVPPRLLWVRCQPGGGCVGEEIPTVRRLFCSALVLMAYTSWSS